VDDIIITGDKNNKVTVCLELICKTFACRDLGILNFFLELNV